MIRKARDNMEAANILAAWPYRDAAANRLYYTLYHCGWAFLVKKNVEVPERESGERWFPHTFFRDLDNEEFGLSLGLPEDWLKRWDEVLNMRIKADYRPDPVRPYELDEEVIGFVEQVMTRAEGFIRET